MTPEQRKAIEKLCERFNDPKAFDTFRVASKSEGLPKGYYTGIVGGIYCGVSPEGEVSS